MSGKIYNYFKPVLQSCTNTSSETPSLATTMQQDNDKLIEHEDLMDDPKDKENVIKKPNNNDQDTFKRKRIDKDDEVLSPTKRRRQSSEEPLTKLRSTDQPDNAVASIEKPSDDTLEKEDSNDEEEEESFDVEKIIDYAYCKESEAGLYLVKWIGWPDDSNTWEPIENLDCREILINFYYQRLEQREASTPAEKRMLQLPPDPRNSTDLRERFLQSHYIKPTQAELEKLFKSKLKLKTPKLLPEADLNKEILNLAKSKKINEKKLEIVRTQLKLRELNKYRTKQMSQLKDWEEHINKIEKDDSHVSVFNDVDLEGPPTMMEYINSYKAGEGITIPDDPPIGCECENCGVGSKTCCSQINGFDFAYSANGKLKVDLGCPIYECNKRCKCPPSCRNRVVQKGRSAKLAIYRTDNNCGWGLKTLDKIKKGSFVVQYAGEVITSEEAELRGRKYDADGRTYLFDLDFNLGDENPYTVDAAFFGNLSHFINHSCDPNLSIYNVYIDCLDPNLPILCLFARRDISKGEQLSFDYCQSTQGQDEDRIRSPTTKTPLKVFLSPTKDKEEARQETGGGGGNKTICRCGAANCRKVLF